MTATVVDGQEPDMDAYLASIVHNTVRVEAAGRTGFGLIVGLRGPELLIATARHTLGSEWDVEPEVCFPPRGDVCGPATVAYLADPVGNQPRLDLAILAVADPGGLAWRPDIEATAAVDDEVWVIGRSRTWWVSPSPGRVVGFEPDSGLIRYADLDVAPGVSGAPVVGRRGVVALHLQAAGDGSGLDLAAVRDRVTRRMGGHWALLPVRSCEAGAATRTLAGRTFDVHIDPDRPAPALEAMALLHCAGARALPRPVADDSKWPTAGLIYRSGDLRAVRALQRLLAPVTRLESDLGEPSGDLDLWIR